MDNLLKGNGSLVVVDSQEESVPSDETTIATHPILIINDDPQMLKLMVRTLEDAGYTVVAVTSGSEALEWMQAAGAVGELPALILLDLALPGRYGAHVAAALRQLARGTIIATSARQSTLRSV